jgi:hypothetical protein
MSKEADLYEGIPDGVQIENAATALPQFFPSLRGTSKGADLYETLAKNKPSY